MSQLVKLLRNASRSTGRPAAGFGARDQEAAHRRLILVAELAALDEGALEAAFAAGADAVQVSAGQVTHDQFKKAVEAASGPLGIAFSGPVGPDLDFKAFETAGADFVKVEAGDVPATVLLLETAAVVLEVKETFTDTMLKMLNFLPARAVQVDAPDDMAHFSIKQLMEKRVDRELIGKPILMNVGPGIEPDAAQLLNLVAPNGLVVPAAHTAAWREALAALKEPAEDGEESSSNISLRAPAA